MIIYCIRHGETPSNITGIVAGRSNESLTEKGIEQAEELNQKIGTKHFDAVFVSPMRRTMQTAEIIIPEANFTIDQRIAERDLGKLKDYTIDELWQMPDWNSLVKLKTDEEAETFASGLLRVRDFLSDLKKKFPDDAEILLITHSFVSRCIWAIVNGYDENTDYSKFHHKNDEIVKYII